MSSESYRAYEILIKFKEKTPLPRCFLLNCNLYMVVHVANSAVAKQQGICHMMIRCPHCGRDGRMADEPAIVRQVLRCRKCQGRFTTHTHHPAGGAPNLEAPFGKVGSSRMVSERGRFSSGPALIASFDDDDLPPMVADPNDFEL